jgi:hypothetical protein
MAVAVTQETVYELPSAASVATAKVAPGLCAPTRWSHGIGGGVPLIWSAFARTARDAPALMRQASANFGSRLAYIVVRPNSSEWESINQRIWRYNRLLVQLAALAARAHTITPLPSNVVVRERFDDYYIHYFELSAVRELFRSNASGCYLVLGQEGIGTVRSASRGSGDIHLFTSWANSQRHLADSADNA